MPRAKAVVASRRCAALPQRTRPSALRSTGRSPAEPPILGVEFGYRRASGLGVETAARPCGRAGRPSGGCTGLFGLPCDAAVLTGKDGGGVEDPGPDR